MKPEQYNVEDLFRSAFENASLEPPRKEDMWAAIQGAVQNQPVPVIPIFRTNWFRASIAASIVLLLGVFYYFGVINSPQQGTKTTNEIATEINSGTQNIEKQNTEDSKIADNAEGSSEKSSTPQDSTDGNDGTSKHQNIALSKHNENSTDGNDGTSKHQNIALSKHNENSTDGNDGTSKHQNIALSKHNENSTDKQDSKVVAAAIIANKIEEEKAFAGVRYEIMEIVALASPEIVIPFAIEEQPILQLVAIVQPIIEVEKTRAENTLWLGFSGFYNSYKPNFQFNTPDLPSPFIKGKLSGINFSDSSNVAKNIRENMTINASVSLNIDFGKVIGKHWFVRSGLGFSGMSYSINSPVVELLAEPNPTNPTVLGKTKVLANTISSAITIINIPIQFGYQSDKKALNYFVGGGISTDILLNNSLTSAYAPAVYDFGNYKALNLSMMGSAGLLYNITSQFSTLVEINYRRSLTSISDASHYSSNPQWIGVGVGIRKKF